ncbi:glycosyltransferase family 4 protein [Georgenia sp. Z1491]|uniref:glycosyltransferase family 4 protein n=1 Tax=Georgenia sp. Z1491 TaxID=3416707 RepID=UPI003CE8A407
MGVHEAKKRVLIIVQNLPVPLDRRVWLECQALRDHGYTVSVICPKGPGDPARHDVDGVALYKYRPAPEAKGAAGFAYEFAYSWLRTAWLSLRVRRERGFDVLQACNPPDTYWLLAHLWKMRGVRFVFDHHDLNPELFLSRFGSPRSVAGRMQLAALRWLERRTFRTADHVISTNESYAEIARRRGDVPQDRVSVVRSGPDTTRMRPTAPTVDVRRGADHLLVYLGIMGPQDDVDVVLHLMDELVHRRGRTTVRAALLGFGDSLDDLRRLSTELNLDPYVEFTGRVGPEEIGQYLSQADVGIGPDGATPLNELSTMNKTMEYMAFALPSVAFDLKETRVSGADAVLYVPDGDLPAMADAVERLLDDDRLRSEMGARGRERAVAVLDWRPQRESYLRAIDRVAGREPSTVPTA